MAQSMETMEELEESNGSVDTSDFDDVATSADWHDVGGEAYKKKASQPLALSADEEDDSSYDDDILLLPKSRKTQKVDEELKKQDEQLRALVKGMPENYEALADTAVMTKKEQKEIKKIKSEWHRISGESAKAHVENLSKARDFLEEEEDVGEELAKPRSRETQKLEDNARRQRRQVEATIQETSDATGALKITKVLSKKERKATRKTKDEWHQVEEDTAKAFSTRLDTTKDYMEDQSDDEGGPKRKSILSRSLEESTRKQQDLVDDMVFDAPDASGALEKIRVFDNRQERRETGKTRREWHDINSAMKRSHDDHNLYRQNEDHTELQIESITVVSPSPRYDDLTPPTTEQTSSKAKAKTKNVAPMSAYPIYDAPVADEDDDSQSKEPILVLKQRISIPGTHQPIEDPEELEPLDTQQKHEWHGVNPVHSHSNPRGSYRQNEEKRTKSHTSVISQEDNEEPKGEKTGKGPEKKTPYRPFEESKKVRKDSSKQGKKPRRSRDGKGSKNSRSIRNDSNFGWQRVSKHSRHDSSKTDPPSINKKNTEPPKDRSISEGNERVVKLSSPMVEQQVSRKERSDANQSETPHTEESFVAVPRQGTMPNGPFDTRPELTAFNHRPLNDEEKASTNEENDVKATAKQPAHDDQIQLAERSRNANHSPGDERIASRKKESDVKQTEKPPSHDKVKLPERSQNVTDPSGTRPEINLFNHHPVDVSAPDTSPPKADEDQACQDEQDDMTTQSEDRHIVRQASRRTLLRRKLEDRRETLASMFHATQEYTLGTENEILDLKKKLALSQALVQMLEVENSDLERRNHFTGSHIRILKPDDDRAKDLELKIKKLMEQRDTAVMECHELRILINGSCDVCRKRFDYHREYTMDYSTRNPILTKRQERKTSAFEWLTAGLAEETGSVKSEGDFNLTRYRMADPDNISMDTTLPESHPPEKGSTIQFVPFQWLSTRLAPNAHQVADIHDNPHRNDPPDVITYKNHEKKDKEPEQQDVNERQPSDTANGPQNYSSNNCSNAMMDQMSTLPSATPNKSASSRLPVSFLGNLLPEKVQDEFSTIVAPSTTSVSTKKAKSFFSSLFGEKVDEETTFAGIDASRTVKLKEGDTRQPRKIGVGLRGEQVLDDMEIFNSIMLISQDTNNSSAKNGNGNRRGFGLGDEKFNEEEHNLRLLSALGEGSSKDVGSKSRNILPLHAEKFDDEDRDSRLLGLLTESNMKKNTVDGSPTSAKVQVRQSGHEYLFSPMSKISSPFSAHESSPRKPVSTNKGRRGGSSSVNYLGRFSVVPDSPNTSAVPECPLPASHPDQNSGSPMGKNPRFLLLNNQLVDDELEAERPWQRDSGTRTTRRPPSKSSFMGDKGSDKKADDSSIPSAGDMTGDGGEEDFDRIAALLAIEGLQ